MLRKYSKSGIIYNLEVIDLNDIRFFSVTDHIENFSIEKEILGDFFAENLSNKTTIILVWHKVIDRDFLIKYPSIRAVVRYGVGYDNVDLEYVRRIMF